MAEKLSADASAFTPAPHTPTTQVQMHSKNGRLPTFTNMSPSSPVPRETNQILPAKISNRSQCKQNFLLTMEGGSVSVPGQIPPILVTWRCGNMNRKRRDCAHLMHHQKFLEMFPSTMISVKISNTLLACSAQLQRVLEQVLTHQI